MLIKKCNRLFIPLLFFLLPSLSFGGQKNIFFFHTYPSTLPWTEKLDSGIETALSTRNDWVLYSEYMDVPRLGDALSEQEWCDYLSRKYESVEFSVIFAESSQAVHFISKYGRELFGDVPIVLFGSEPLDITPKTFYLKSQQDIAVVDTYNTALKQNPKKRKIVIIHNQPGFYMEELKDLRRLVEVDGLEMTLLSDFSLAELYSSIENLKGDEIVFFFPFFSDAKGERLTPFKVLKEISSLSPSPVYTFWSSLFESGCVGGVMVDSRKIAMEMFRAADDFFQNGTYGSDYTTNQSFVDWNAVKTYHLHLSGLSHDTVIINKPVSFFKTYSHEIMIASSVVLAVFLAVALCILSRINRIKRRLQILNCELKKAHQKAEELALKDPLTGLLNRRALMKVIDYEINRNHRISQPLSFTIIDIDHFKVINDTYGHEVGDKVLQSLSDLFLSSIRKTDRVARWGGEEFMLVTADTGIEKARGLGEKLRQSVEKNAFPRQVPVTISLGVGQYDGSENFEACFQRIDAALYKAKEEGRNRVCMANLP